MSDAPRVQPGEILVTQRSEGRYDTTIGLETAVAGVAAPSLLEFPCPFCRAIEPSVLFLVAHARGAHPERVEAHRRAQEGGR